jgi:hypothetical protein
MKCLFIQANLSSSRLNEYVKPITDLLRETEGLNLAPELLEPDPQSISKVSGVVIHLEVAQPSLFVVSAV